MIDRLLMLRVLSMLYSLVRRARPEWIPKFARKAAMGIDVVFR